MRAALILAFAATAAAASCAGGGAGALDPALKSANDFENVGLVTVHVENKAPFDVTMWWLDFDGNEHYNGLVGEGDNTRLNSHNGHAFVFRTMVTHQAIQTVQADVKDPKNKAIWIVVEGCDEALAAEADHDENHGWKARAAEFEALVDTGDACVGDDSSKWSCLRTVTAEERENRDPALYGFATKEGGRRKDGDQEDHGYTKQQHKIPHISERPGGSKGYLKLKHTARMKELLYPWYHEKLLTDVEDHGVIHGGYTNNHKVSMSKIDLDKNGHQHLGLVREMREVLQWWCQMKLRHTSTFGLRIYERDSMLINHLDIEYTHLASAVIQVGQKVDPNGGWPLEVMNPDGTGALTEVYLQEGEMVLYEGARLKHGRPMRFRGEQFGNIFSHFAPYKWKGLNVPYEHEKFKDEL